MRFAVLVDAENLSPDCMPAILAFVKSFGETAIVRLHGDFSQERLTGWLDLAREQGFGLTLQLSAGKAKNTTDIAMTIAAMDLLHGGNVDGFCVASDDRDFVPLVDRMRVAGKPVLVVCRSADPRLHALGCEVLELRVPPLVAAFRRVANGQNSMSLQQLGQLLRRHAPEQTPVGSGKLRKALRETGWFEEKGTGATLAVILRERPDRAGNRLSG